MQFSIKKLIREVTYKKVKGGLVEITGTAYFELFVAIFWIIYLQSFIADHLNEPKFLIPAIILIAISVFSSVLGIKKLMTFYSINADKTVIKTQKQLLRLKWLEKVDITSILVTIPLFSAPFFIVLTKDLLGMDLYIFSDILTTYTIGSGVVAIILFVILRKVGFGQIDKAIKQLEKFQ